MEQQFRNFDSKEFIEDFGNVYSNFNMFDPFIKFERESHIAFLKYTFNTLKKHKSMDPHKMTILYFIAASLIILKEFSEEEKELSVIFVLQNAVIENYYVKGFRGGPFTGWTNNPNINYQSNNFEDKPHIAATYCALCILKMCSYDSVDKINKKLAEFYFGKSEKVITLSEEYIIKEIQNSQNENGQFCAQSFDTEKDVRFFYCAVAIIKMLGKTTEEIQKLINFEKGVKFLNSIRNYEGGFSMEVGGESNAGITYCAIASYQILGVEISNINNLLFWLSNRCSSLGINGRTNKVPDSCYYFWVTSCLSMLNFLDIYDNEFLKLSLMNFQSNRGGFSKHLNFDQMECPDILHTFYSLAALSLLGEKNLNTIDPLLAISIFNY